MAEKRSQALLEEVAVNAKRPKLEVHDTITDMSAGDDTYNPKLDRNGDSHEDMSLKDADNTQIHHSDLQTDSVGSNLDHHGDAENTAQNVGEVDMADTVTAKDVSEVDAGAKTLRGEENTHLQSDQHTDIVDSNLNHQNDAENTAHIVGEVDMADTVTAKDASEVDAGVKTLRDEESTQLQHSDLHTDSVGSEHGHCTDAQTAQNVGEVAVADPIAAGDASEVDAGVKTLRDNESTCLQHSDLQSDSVGNSLNNQNDAESIPQIVGEVDVADSTDAGDACELEDGAKTQTGLLDPLSYTKSEEFTSEIFKIQIHNLPKFGFNDLKKRLKSTLKLNPHKIKSDRRYVTYICFKNEQDRDEALGKLNGHVWKGKTLQAKIAAPVADPYLRKRHVADNEKSQTGKDSADVAPVETSNELTKEEAEARLRANVSPLWDTDYTQQLQIKTNKIKEVLGRLMRNNFVKHMFNSRSTTDGLPCHLLPIVPSPVTSEYRNKNEFTVGYCLDGQVMVGFRYGLYKEGTTAVGESTSLGIAMPAAIPVVQSFREFVAKSKWLPFRQETGSGHWQTLTVRTFLTGDVMVMINFVPRKMEQAEIENVKASLKEFYTAGEGKHVKITSFYFRVMGDKGQTVKPSSELLFGESHVFESLMNLRFRISPEAFFQVNTAATEKLYQLISDWCEVSPATTVLDICCGTGTIGLSMAKKVKQVIGIEMCPQAVEDAKVNAAINEIDNATFHCAKVEDVINKVMSSVESSCFSDIVAVVDPPRPGLHKDVIKTLRRSSSIHRLVYVSCNPESALDNLVDLLRPETGRHKGAPFKMIKAIPVDLFPGTRHCELVILFSRGNSISTTDIPATLNDVVACADDVSTVKDDKVENVLLDRESSK